MSLGTSVPNLVSLTHSSLQILDKTQTGISDFWISGQSLIKVNYHNSRTSDDIDMKLGPVTKLDKRNKTAPKKLTMTSCWQVVTSLSFFWFMANLELFGSRILDSEPLKSQPRLGLNCFSVRCICCYQQKRG